MVGPHHVSNAKKPGCLGYIGDEKLPSYIGIIISHYKDPGFLLTNQDSMESRFGFFSWLMWRLSDQTIAGWSPQYCSEQKGTPIPKMAIKHSG